MIYLRQPYINRNFYKFADRNIKAGLKNNIKELNIIKKSR